MVSHMVIWYWSVQIREEGGKGEENEISFASWVGRRAVGG